MAGYIRGLKDGFSDSFWIANTLELFERIATYCSVSVLAVYLTENIGFGPTIGPSLVGLFSGLLYTLPILAGSIVDRFGFRRTLVSCFAIFAPGYFLIGLAGLDAARPVVDGVGRTPFVLFALMVTAVGGSLIKPCVVGTVASTTSSRTRALGYSIYYTLVNIGAALGPLVALQVRGRLGIQCAFFASTVLSIGNLTATILFFKEPLARSAAHSVTMGRVFGDMLTVFGNIRFLLFLVLASGFYILFWQLYYSIPFYARHVLHFEHFEFFQTVDGAAVILLTIPVNILVKKWKPITGIVIGLTIASVAWLLIPFFPAVSVAFVAIIFFAIGEAALAPRLYEYVSTLAPQDRLGTYMGFAFLPVAIGSFTAGPLAGWLIPKFVMGPNPNAMWFILSGVGLVCAAGMLVHNSLLRAKSVPETVLVQ